MTPNHYWAGEHPCLVTEANSTHGIGEDAEDAANTLNPAVDL